MPVIGFLHSASPEPNADRVRAFRQALKDTGYVEGENVAEAEQQPLDRKTVN
jgi:putative ABC transport system substrate-binding protein